MFKDLTLSEIYNKETPFESLVPGTGIVLIGRAFIGPAMVPVKVSEIQDATMMFGVNSELANAFIEAKMSGASDVYLVRINGTHAETNVQDAIRLTSLEAIGMANQLQYEVITSGADRYLTLLNPVTGYNSSYYLTDKTISEIVSEINVDAVTFQSPVCATMLQEGSTDILIDEYFSDAQTTGADPQPGQSDVRRIVELLEYLDAFPIAQVGILSSPFYTVYEDGYLYGKLTEFAEKKTRGCIPCIVTIGTDELSHVYSSLYDLARDYKENIKFECPVSEFVNIVLAKPVFPALYPEYVSNGVAAYCGLINGNAYYEGTTNKRLNGAVKDELTFTSDVDDRKNHSSDELRAELADFGYVVFITGRFNAEQQVRVLKGVNLVRGFNKVVDVDSASYKRYIPAPMSNIANVKLIQYIIYQLNDVLQLEELSQISTLRARISEVLDAEAEYIKDYKVNVTESYQGFAKTYVVGVEITPVGELSSLTLTMQTR